MKTSSRAILAATVCVLAGLPAVAVADGTPTTIWSRQTGTSVLDECRGVGLDAAGNVYVGGYTEGSLGGPNQGDEDILIGKYSSAGEPQWLRQVGTSSEDIVKDIAVDSSGNVYVVGWTCGELGGTHQGEGDAFLLAYDSNGNERWRKQIGTPLGDSAWGVSVDGNGNCYIGGTTYGSVASPQQGDGDFLVIKYSPAGTEQWRQQFGTAAADWVKDIAVDSAGNCYVAGTTGGDLGSANQGGVDAVVAKLDASGNPEWTWQLGSGTMDLVRVVVADDEGNCIISGHTWGSLAGAYQGGDHDSFIAKCDSSGTELWRRQIGTDQRDVTYGIVADGDGNTYLTGYTGGDIGSENLGGYDLFVSKYDTVGAKQWSWQTGTDANDAPMGIALGADHKLYLAGYTNGSLASPNQGDRDLFVMAVTPEPATVSLLAAGGMVLLRRKRLKAVTLRKEQQ